MHVIMAGIWIAQIVILSRFIDTNKGNGNECGVKSLSLLLLDTASVDSFTIIHFYSQKNQKDKAVSWLHVLGHGLVLRHGQTSGIYSCLSHSFTSPLLLLFPLQQAAATLTISSTSLLTTKLQSKSLSLI